MAKTAHEDSPAVIAFLVLAAVVALVVRAYLKVQQGELTMNV
jgi:hypothetical protein